MSDTPVDETLHVFNLDDGERYWIVAKDADTALRHGRERYEVPAHPEDEVSVELVPDDHDLWVTFMDDAPEEQETLPEGHRIDGNRVTATAEAWAAWAGDGHMLGSTIY